MAALNANKTTRSRLTLLAFELIFSATTSFLFTLALLPLFGLHPSTLVALRVTAVSTAVVFAALGFVFGTIQRTSAPPNEKLEFKLNPRAVRDVEKGWPHEKVTVESLRATQVRHFSGPSRPLLMSNTLAGPHYSSSGLRRIP
jgi:hypothetical protein